MRQLSASWAKSLTASGWSFSGSYIVELISEDSLCVSFSWYQLALLDVEDFSVWITGLRIRLINILSS